MERHRPRRQAEHNPRETLATTMRLLKEGITQLLDDEPFARYLRVMSRLHQYSFGNVALILAQRPDATRVAGYRRLQELGRQVKRSERGITILVPHTRVVELEDGDETQVVRSFGVGTVFDIAQTEGEPLPEPPRAR